ncbi:MAG: response regulator [Candidatus Aminicenantales bacterium]
MEEKARVLLVDDNISLCKTMSFILKRKGHLVSIASNGVEAIRKVKKNPFDIIFIDIKMPLLDGVETYRRIKEIRPEALVIMMTAYVGDSLIQQALKEGVHNIIYKPLDIETVLSLIEQARKRKKGALVLVVDDDHATCMNLKNILIRRRYDVCIANDGDEAVAMAKQRAFDIVFIDMKLPTLNGLETYLAIKEINPHAAAIMMTGYREEMSELVEEALENNAYACLYKPFDMGEVLKLVDSIMEGKQREN